VARFGDCNDWRVSGVERLLGDFLSDSLGSMADFRGQMPSGCSLV
jgi:hypothetical protein